MRVLGQRRRIRATIRAISSIAPAEASMLDRRKIGDERRTAFQRPVSRRLFPNRACAFRYAPGSPEDKAKSGVLIHA
jgi:hypothetical protein